MSKLYAIEPIVYEALMYHPDTRGDNFLLYIEVLNKYINTNMPLKEVFSRHKELGIPSLESITRCRRKLQEQNPCLRDEAMDEIRRQEANSYIDYARGEE